MESTDDQIQKSTGWKKSPWWIVSLGILLLILSYGLDIGVRHTDLREGLQMGLINGIFLGSGLCILYFPWCAVVCIALRKRWRSWRHHLLLWPPVLIFGSVMVSLLTTPPTAENSFQQFMGVPLPDKSENFRYYFWGGGLTDRSVIYCFETTPAEVERLIHEMDLERKTVWSPDGPQSFPGRWPFPDPPDLQRWKVSEYHEGRRRKSFRHLIIDRERRLIYASYSTY